MLNLLNTCARNTCARIVLSTAFLAASSLVVQAGDDLPAPVYPVATWSGFYAGVHAGAVDSQTRIRDEDYTLFDTDGATAVTNDLTGLTGIHGGYNWQDGHKVFGIEADYTWTSAGRTRLLRGAGQNLSSDLSGFGSIRGRAGVAVDNALLYLTGGIGYVDADVGGGDNFDDQFVSESDFRSFVAGAGAEFKLRSNLSLRLEYMHHLFNEKTVFCEYRDCVYPAVFGGSLGVLRAGLTYHFGQGAEEVVQQGNDVWSGFYGGLHAGAVDTVTGVQDEDGDVLDIEGIPVHTNGLDVAAGIHGGYNWLFGSALVGVEADYSWTNSGFSRIYDREESYLSSQIDGIASVRARLGLAAGNALAYVTGGGALINAQIQASAIGLNSTGDNVSFDNFAALVMGAGAEIKITPNLSLRGEYLYYAFDEQSTVCPGCRYQQPQFADGQIHSFRAGLSYYLNANGTEMPQVAVADWAGFYGGLHAGLVDSTTGMRDEHGTVFGYGGNTVFTTSRDIGGGVYAGYHYQMQNAVIGVEADYTFTNSGDSRNIDNISQFVSSQIEGFGSVRGKIGLAVGDAMFYTTGGIGFVQADMSGADEYRTDTTQTVSFSGFTALVAGAGTEFKLKEDLSIRAEYLYYGFDEQSDLCTVCGVDPTYADGQLHTFRVGLTKFF